MSLYDRNVFRLGDNSSISDFIGNIVPERGYFLESAPVTLFSFSGEPTEINIPITSLDDIWSVANISGVNCGIDYENNRLMLTCTNGNAGTKYGYWSKYNIFSLYSQHSTFLHNAINVTFDLTIPDIVYYRKRFVVFIYIGNLSYAENPEYPKYIKAVEIELLREQSYSTHTISVDICSEIKSGDMQTGWDQLFFNINLYDSNYQNANQNVYISNIKVTTRNRTDNPNFILSNDWW